MSHLTVDRAILEALRERAESAAHLVGHIDLADCRLSLLSDDIDAIVHELNELLGNRHRATPTSSGHSARTRRSELAPALDPARFVIGSTDDESMRPHTGGLRSKFLLGNSPPRALPLTIERKVSCESDSIVRLIVFADEPTQPHKVRADDRQARGHRAISGNVARASLWWRRGATVTGLIVLAELVVRVLGSCGGAR